MGVFMVFELLIIIALLYFAGNLIRYFFFRETDGGGLFGLSDKWIAQDEEKQRQREAKKEGGRR